MDDLKMQSTNSDGTFEIVLKIPIEPFLKLLSERKPVISEHKQEDKLEPILNIREGDTILTCQCQYASSVEKHWQNQFSHQRQQNLL
jgi:hypothetical protein